MLVDWHQAASLTLAHIHACVTLQHYSAPLFFGEMSKASEPGSNQIWLMGALCPLFLSSVTGKHSGSDLYQHSPMPSSSLAVGRQH